MSAKTPKIAIVYYSKSGHSGRVAERLAAVLGADLHQLRTPRYHVPFLGYMRAGLDSLRLVSSPLVQPLPDIQPYDAVIICGPVWTSYPAAPLLSYLRQQKNVPTVLGLLLTCGGHSPPEKAYAKAQKETGLRFVAEAAVSNSIEALPEAEGIITAFAEKILNALNRRVLGAG